MSTITAIPYRIGVHNLLGARSPISRPDVVRGRSQRQLRPRIRNPLGYEHTPRPSALSSSRALRAGHPQLLGTEQQINPGRTLRRSGHG
jgi:hypothetical protein